MPVTMHKPAGEEADPREGQDALRCRQVENALYRRAKGYKIRLKKSFKVKVIEYDPDTGKKVAEREDLKDGFEEVHVPADVRIGTYYLNNRDPARWREHPEETVDGEILGGLVAYPEMAETEPSGEEVT